MDRFYGRDEVAKHCTCDDCWVILFDEVFDVTDFMRSGHTGGYFPLSGAGKDCSALFVSIHPTTAFKHLRDPDFRKRCFKGRVAPAPESDAWNLDEPFYFETKRAVERYLETSSVGPRDDPVLLKRAAFIFLAFAVSGCVTFCMGSWLCMPLFVVAALVFSFEVVHTLNHGGLTTNRAANAIMQFLGNMNMNSAPAWREKHSVSHHVATNHDKDADTHNAPALRHSFHDPWRWYYAYQHIYMYPLYVVVYPVWVVKHLLTTWSAPNYLLSEKVSYYVAMTIVAVVMGWVPARRFGARKAVAMLAAYLALVSVAIACVFSVSHTNVRAEMDATRNWAENQVRSSVNWGTGNSWANFFTGGLNHQIEHHLFPSVHPIHYPAISAIVREKCDKYRIPYRTNDDGALCGFWESLKQHHAFARVLGNKNASSKWIKKSRHAI